MINTQQLLAMGYTANGNVWSKQMKTCTITVFPTAERDIVIRRIMGPGGQMLSMTRMKQTEIETDALYIALVHDQNRPVASQVIIPAVVGTPISLKGKDPGKVLNLKARPQEEPNG
jgi:hypothetical protein